MNKKIFSRNSNLSTYTTIKVGGVAEYFAERWSDVVKIRLNLTSEKPLYARCLYYRYLWQKKGYAKINVKFNLFSKL